jgi:bifunctional DNase/RNase
MIEVTIDSIRVSLMSQHRVVVLKDSNSDRYLPIWIGPCEADAITIELQEMPPQRPLTHDLLKTVIREMGGKVVHILINDLRNDVYYARIVVDVKGTQVEIDSRPSDAIALAVRVKTPIFVADVVMDKAAIEPDEDVEKSLDEEALGGDSEVEPGRLSAFADFVDSLDLDDLEDSED